MLVKAPDGWPAPPPRSFPLEGRVAAKRPGGVVLTRMPLLDALLAIGALPEGPHPARCAGHPLLEGEGAPGAGSPNA